MWHGKKCFQYERGIIKGDIVLVKPVEMKGYMNCTGMK